MNNTYRHLKGHTYGFLFLIVLGISQSAFATDVRGRIDSRNPSNGYFQPVPGALVQLLHANSSISASATTSYDGFYYFYSVKPGQYVLKINNSISINVLVPDQTGFDMAPVLLN